VPPGARISSGIHRALRAVLEIVPPPGLPGAGQALLEHLREEARRAAIRIAVSGHSLGGVLASVLGVALADTRAAAGPARGAPWNPDGSARISVHSSGAQTPGNAAFAKHADERLADGHHRLVNTRDVVPRMWTAEGLREVPSFYDGVGKVVVSWFCEWAARRAAPVGYAHPSCGERSFTGEIDPSQPGTALQGLHQHGMAYVNHLALAPLSLEDILSV
jgi:hypothetical protein